MKKKEIKKQKNDDMQGRILIAKGLIFEGLDRVKNANTLVIGDSKSGKLRSYVQPNVTFSAMNC